MIISHEDRSALLKERIVVHSVHHYEEFGTHMYVTGPDEKQARKAITARFGDEVEVTVCGDEPRAVLPRKCDGHMEREPGRLQLRYTMGRWEHVNEIVVAETDSEVVVCATICAPIDLESVALIETPCHVYLDQPLGERVVFDAVADAPVPYFNVYDGIEERVASARLLEEA